MPRMTEERLAQIREHCGWSYGDYEPDDDIRDLLSELAAVTKERDKAVGALEGCKNLLRECLAWDKTELQHNPNDLKTRIQQELELCK